MHSYPAFVVPPAGTFAASRSVDCNSPVPERLARQQTAGSLQSAVFNRQSQSTLSVGSSPVVGLSRR